MNDQDNSLTFKLDDPINIKGEVTPERASQIIARMNQLMAEERRTPLDIPIYYR